jgi:hypothetical protein
LLASMAFSNASGRIIFNKLKSVCLFGLFGIGDSSEDSSRFELGSRFGKMVEIDADVVPTYCPLR